LHGGGGGTHEALRFHLSKRRSPVLGQPFLLDETGLRGRGKESGRGNPKRRKTLGNPLWGGEKWYQKKGLRRKITVGAEVLRGTKEKKEWGSRGLEIEGEGRTAQDE